jgi:hypothetical protein
MAVFSLIGSTVAGWLFTAGTSAFLIAKTVIAGTLAFGAKLAFSYINRPKKRAYTAMQGEFLYGADVPVGAMFGTGAIRPHSIYYAFWGPGDRFNAEVMLLSNGWCDGLEPIIRMWGRDHVLVPRDPIGDEIEHWGVDGFGSLISIRFYDGRPGQPADAKLVADTAALDMNWKATSRCTGLAYVVFEYAYQEGKYEDGWPEPEHFVLRGLREYDPTRDDTVAGGSGPHRLDDPATWDYQATNPALHRLNYQLGLRARTSDRTLVGEGKTLGQLDLSSYFASIAVCDTPRNGKPTYACSLYATGDDDHTEILAMFEDAMAGYGLNRHGLSGVIAGAPQIPVAEIGVDDIDAGRPREVKYRKSSYETFNHLSGQYLSPELGWKPNSLKPVHVNADIAADGNRVRQQRNDFLQVTDADAGQYLLDIRYRQNRLGGREQLPVSRRMGLKAIEGSWVTHDGRDWLVAERAIDAQLRFTLTLAETSAEIYDDGDIQPGPIVIPPQPPVNPSVLSTVQGFGVEVGMLLGDDGYETPVLRFTWTPPEDPTITAVRFEYFQGADPTGQTFYYDQTPDVEAGVYVTSKDVAPGFFYTARATITTVPDRLKTYTPWVTTLHRAGPTQIRTYLDALGNDVRGTIVKLRADLEASRLRLEELALAVAEGQGVTAQEHSVARRFQNASASAFQELSASIETRARVFRQPEEPVANADGDIWFDTDDDNFMRVWSAADEEWQDAASLGVSTYAQDTEPVDPKEGDIWIDTTDGENVTYRFDGADWIDLTDGRLVATAAAVTALNATVGDISGDGLWKMEVVAGTGDVVARAVIMMRASISDDFVEVGTVWEAGFVGGDPDEPFARIVNIANQFVITDGTEENLPLIFEGGELKLQVARIGTAIVELLESESGKSRFGTLAVGVEGFEVLS